MSTIKRISLEPPLSYLVDYCETMCVASCCGLDAYDFSPIHIASHLIKYRRHIESKDVEAILSQLTQIRQEYGTANESSVGVEIELMNHIFSVDAVDCFVDEIVKNIAIAAQLSEQSDESRYYPTA